LRCCQMLLTRIAQLDGILSDFRWLGNRRWRRFGQRACFKGWSRHVAGLDCRYATYHADTPSHIAHRPEPAKLRKKFEIAKSNFGRARIESVVARLTITSSAAKTKTRAGHLGKNEKNRKKSNFDRYYPMAAATLITRWKRPMARSRCGKRVPSRHWACFAQSRQIRTACPPLSNLC
jgi:hypothetical protein